MFEFSQFQIEKLIPKHTLDELQSSNLPLFLVLEKANNCINRHKPQAPNTKVSLRTALILVTYLQLANAECYKKMGPEYDGKLNQLKTEICDKISEKQLSRDLGAMFGPDKIGKKVWDHIRASLEDLQNREKYDVFGYWASYAYHLDATCKPEILLMMENNIWVAIAILTGHSNTFTESLSADEIVTIISLHFQKIYNFIHEKIQQFNPIWNPKHTQQFNHAVHAAILRIFLFNTQYQTVDALADNTSKDKKKLGDRFFYFRGDERDKDNVFLMNLINSNQEILIAVFNDLMKPKQATKSPTI